MKKTHSDSQRGKFYKNIFPCSAHCCHLWTTAQRLLCWQILLLLQLKREIAWSKQWRSQPKTFGGEIFRFRRATVFCLGHRFSKQKMTGYGKNYWRGMAPWPPLATPIGSKILACFTLIKCWHESFACKVTMQSYVKRWMCRLEPSSSKVKGCRNKFKSACSS